jgi:predicted esterase
MVEPPMPKGKRHTGSTRLALDRAWTLDVPDGDAPAGGFPLLLALHGYGEDGARMAARFEAIADPPYARLFPDAPYPVLVEASAGDGPRAGASWYHYTGDQPAFLRALAFAESYLRDVVADAARCFPIDAGRIVLCGYSQGGYLAAGAAFRDRARYRALAGVACRVKTEALEHEIAAARGYPALLIHGARDKHTALDRQREAVELLVQNGVDATLHVHEGGHGFRPDLAPMIDAFARRVLGV